MNDKEIQFRLDLIIKHSEDRGIYKVKLEEAVDTDQFRDLLEAQTKDIEKNKRLLFARIIQIVRNNTKDNQALLDAVKILQDSAYDSGYYAAKAENSPYPEAKTRLKQSIEKRNSNMNKIIVMIDENSLHIGKS